MIEEIVKTYGLNAQLNMVMEESGELVSVCMDIVSSSARTGCVDSKHIDESALIEEMAHVRNTILSVCLLMEIPLEQVEKGENLPVSDGVRSELEQRLLKMTCSCGNLIKSCNKVLRAGGYGYKTPATPMTAKVELVNSMRHMWTDISGICNFLGISEEKLNEEISRSDKVTYERLVCGRKS